MPPSRTRSAMTERPRIVGIDALRGLAVLGMFAAHVGDYGWRDSEGDGWAWLWIADGRASATFALLAGVAISLMVRGRAASAEPAPFRRAATKVAARAVIVIGIGYALQRLGTPVLVVLMSLGVMMLLALPLARLPLSVLGAVAAVFAIAGPFVVHALAPRAAATGWDSVPVLNTLWGHYYTGLIWMAYLCVGMLVGRLDLSSGTALWAVARWGAALAAIGYVVLPAFGGTGPLPHAPLGDIWWLSAAAHSREDVPPYGPPEVIGNVGVILLAIALLVWMCRAAPRALAPIAAVGSMALTVYAGQIVALWVMDRAAGGYGSYDAVYNPSNVTLVVFALVAIAFAWIWRTVLGAGPLERIVSAASNAAARASAGTPPRATATYGPPQ